MMEVNWMEAKLEEFQYRRWIYKVYIAFPNGYPHLKVVELDPTTKTDLHIYINMYDLVRVRLNLVYLNHFYGYDLMLQYKVEAVLEKPEYKMMFDVLVG